MRSGTGHVPIRATKGEICVIAMPCTTHGEISAQVDNSNAIRHARYLLARAPHFRRYAAGIEFEIAGNVLVVHGRVPTFYLKQLLQSALMRLEHVEQVDNRVEVISSYGLSSVR
jgi:hypothetical protein